MNGGNTNRIGQPFQQVYNNPALNPGAKPPAQQPSSEKTEGPKFNADAFIRQTPEQNHLKTENQLFQCQQKFAGDQKSLNMFNPQLPSVVYHDLRKGDKPKSDAPPHSPSRQIASGFRQLLSESENDLCSRFSFAEDPFSQNSES